MAESKRCNVVGFPINHSLSPYLFALVHEHLGLSWKMPRKISTSDINEIYDLREKLPLLTTEFEQMIKFVTNEINGENIDISEMPSIEIYEIITSENNHEQLINYEKSFNYWNNRTRWILSCRIFIK